MASPQLENGYVKIANELFEAFIIHKFTEYQRVIILFIWRKTYGFNKPKDFISNGQFVRGTGIPKWHVWRTLRELKEKNIVACTGNKISINKDWERWKVACRGNKKLPVQVHTKDNIKDNNNKDMKLRNQNAFSDEEDKVIDVETQTEVIADEREAKQDKTMGNVKKSMWALLRWAENRRGQRFPEYKNQFKSMKLLMDAKITIQQAQERWKELENDTFWKNKLDFHSLVISFNKKP